jgi:hypothetical protein
MKNRLFLIALYLVMLLETFLRSFNGHLFWGNPKAILERGDLSGLNFVFSSLEYYPQLWSVLVAFLILFLILEILGFTHSTYRLFIWLLYGTINHACPVIADGGSGIMLILSFYAILLNDEVNQISIALNRTAQNLIKFQVCFIYLSAGLAKVHGELWSKGVAIYYALQVDQFSHPWVQDNLANNALFVTLATYATLAFQLSFPVGIWHPKLRPWLIAIGTLIHLQISFMMGLLTFGLVMSASYIVFYDEKRCAYLLSLGHKFKLKFLRKKYEASSLPHRSPFSL